MKTCVQPLGVLSLSCLAVSLSVTPKTFAQEPGRELDDLGKRISKQIAKAGIHSIVVADFVSQDGSDSIQGRYLAEEFAQRLDHHKKNFVLTERKQLSSALSDAQLTARDLSAADALLRIGNSLQVEAIVTGTFETTSAQYSVSAIVRSVRDGSDIASGNEMIKRPAYVDSLAALDPTGSIQETARPGIDGVSVPSCVTCPAPKFAERGEAARVSGRAIMLVVVTSEGRAGGIAVVDASNDGLSKKAVETVTGWKFKPATDKEGNPVSVIIPIEITVNSY
jgi:TonB family protein